MSVVIPCYLLDEELLDFTKNCVESVHEHCNDFELVLVDNGSPIGGDYLRGVADVYVRNQSNLGFAPAVNQGLKVASGEWLVVCNNDVRFFGDWLSEARGAWEHKTGVVAAHRKAGRKLRRSTPWHVVWGALWMTRRAVVDEIGYLDEGFTLGFREDRDYWLRMLEAGYELTSVGHAWHKGNATWRKLPKAERKAAYAKNKERFHEKWPDV